jgi:hypothetical protein
MAKRLVSMVPNASKKRALIALVTARLASLPLISLLGSFASTSRQVFVLKMETLNFPRVISHSV